MIKMTFKQLEVFVTVARLGNMTHASEELYLTQSACSMALSTLEEQLNGPLFDRHGKKLILNERGKTLFPIAFNLMGQAQEAQDLMTEKKLGLYSGNLIVGASTTIGNYLLPLIIGKFVKKYQQAKVKLRVENTEQVIDEILKFNIDIGLIEGACHSEQIEIIPWKQDELIIIASPKHPFAKKSKITRAELLTAEWILREPGSGTRSRFEETLGAKLNSIFELGHTEAIKQAVQAGLGVSCLSKTTVMEALRKKQLIEIKAPFLKLTRDFYFILHKEKYKTTLAKEFIKFCQSSK
jgi:DNA-binding transcriptional LysR family regulator